jgi:hypothetical protein
MKYLILVLLSIGLLTGCGRRWSEMVKLEIRSITTEGYNAQYMLVYFTDGHHAILRRGAAVGDSVWVSTDDLNPSLW